MGQKDKRIRERREPQRLQIDPKSIVAQAPVKIIEPPLTFNIRIDSGKVVMQFPRKVEFVVMSPEEAIGIGVHLFKLGRKLKPELTAGVMEKAALEPTNAPIIPPDAVK